MRVKSAIVVVQSAAEYCYILLFAAILAAICAPAGGQEEDGWV